MVAISTLQRYIKQCDDVIENDDVYRAESLEKEIVAVFQNEIDGIRSDLSNYSPCAIVSASDGRTISSGTTVEYISDIKLLRSKLQMKLEKNESVSGATAGNKKNKVFISHASKDSEYVGAFVNLLEDIGLSEDEIVCSSISGYGIPLGEDIYDWLSSQFQEYNLHIIFMLSNNYYQSVACLNEMGAAWVLKQKYDSILLPGFDFVQIKGAINPNKIAIKLDGDVDDLSHRLHELKDNLIGEFNLKASSAAKWERHRNEFIRTISSITSGTEDEHVEPEEHKNSISKDAGILLVYAANSSDGQVTMLKSISGLSICGGKWNFVGDSPTAREESRWEDAVIELENYGFIDALSYKRQVFRITTIGYKVADEIKEKLNIDTDKSPDEYLEN